MSPIVDTLSLSNTGSHVVPLFVVFQTPPDAVPAYTMFGLLSTTPKSSMRPPITAGPISRNSKFFSLSAGLAWPAVSLGRRIAIAKQNSTPAKVIFKADETRRIFFPLVCKAGHHTSSMPRRASIVSGMAKQPVFRQTRGTHSTFRAHASIAPAHLCARVPAVFLTSATHHRSRVLGYPTVFIAQMFCVNGRSHARVTSALRSFVFLIALLFSFVARALPNPWAQQIRLHSG